jgi:hypothetical protein
LRTFDDLWDFLFGAAVLVVAEHEAVEQQGDGHGAGAGDKIGPVPTQVAAPGNGQDRD